MVRAEALEHKARLSASDDLALDQTFCRQRKIPESAHWKQYMNEGTRSIYDLYMFNFKFSVVHLN